MSYSVDISVAIPDSCLLDVQTLRDKTQKIGQMARASSIFRVKSIYVYRDSDAQVKEKDRCLIKLILRYLDTPQYLRKAFFPHMQELRYAGILPPIKAPHHKEWIDLKKVKEGEIRVGVVVRVKDKFFVDIGLNSPARLEGKAPAGTKVYVKLKSTSQSITAKEIKIQDIGSYWGFQVYETKSLKNLLDQAGDSVVVITSRQGQSLKGFKTELLQELKFKKRILLVFGSPRRGAPEILSGEGYAPSSYQFLVNMFPYQGTQTVRLEEAFLGTLAIINCFLNS